MTEQVASQAIGRADGDIGDERQHYFEGKFMSARDFRDEQHYFLSRHRAHNRLLHGWGVICGLSVSGLERDGCRDRWLRIGPGAALDCLGRELILEEELCLELPDRATVRQWADDGLERKLGVDLLPFPERRPPGAAAAQAKARSSAPEQVDEAESVTIEQYGHENGRDEDQEVEFLIALAYREEKIEQVPALLDSDCDPPHLEYNRVREGLRVVVVRYDPAGHCWTTKGHVAHGEPPCHDDCDDDQPGPGGSCIKPDCPCGRVVPVALVRARVDAGGYLAGDFRLINARQADREEQATGARPAVTIETDGRRRLPTPPSFLTHIVRINWPHGGTLDLSELQAGGRLDGRLEITFDRDIQPAETYERRADDLYDPEAGEMNGINRFTFRVTYATARDNVEQEVNFAQRAGLDPNDRRKAVFYIDPKSWSIDEEDDRLPECNVFIRLLGDFVLDCHGNPIDANHVGGQLPSGNGSSGGTFESWFRLKHDHFHRPRPAKAPRVNY